MVSQLHSAESLSMLLVAAMRGFASTVTVVSAVGATGVRHAMTATSPTSVSVDPPSMLVCVNRTSRLYEILAEGADFCINILRAEQLPIARLCSSRENGEARFNDSAWACHPSGVPYLTTAQAAILCRQAATMSHGTHEVVIGEVADIFLSDPIDPLVYADGGYRTLTAMTF